MCRARPGSDTHASLVESGSGRGRTDDIITRERREIRQLLPVRSEEEQCKHHMNMKDGEKKDT